LIFLQGGIVVIQFFSRTEKSDADLLSVEDQFEDDDGNDILEDEELTDQF